MNLTIRFFDKNQNRSSIKTKSQTTDYQLVLSKTFSAPFRIPQVLNYYFLNTKNI